MTVANYIIYNQMIFFMKFLKIGTYILFLESPVAVAPVFQFIHHAPLERVGNATAFSGNSAMVGKALTLTVNAFEGHATHHAYVFQVADIVANIRKTSGRNTCVSKVK